MSVLYVAIDWLLGFMELAILARVIISWLPIPKENQLINILYQITEPILAPIRSALERSAFGRNMMMDFSPVVAFLLISLVRSIFSRFIY